MSISENHNMSPTGRPTSPTGTFPISDPPISSPPTGPFVPPQQYGPESYGTAHHSPKPPKKKRGAVAMVLWCVLGALVLVVGIGVIGALASSSAKKPTATATGAPRPATPAAEPTPAKTYPVPALADFILVTKVTK